MPNLSLFLNKINDKKNENIIEGTNDNLGVDIFSLLNEGSFCSSDSSDNSYIDKSINNSISSSKNFLATKKGNINYEIKLNELNEIPINDSKQINAHSNDSINEVYENNIYYPNKKKEDYDCLKENFTHLDEYPYEINNYDDDTLNKINEQFIDNSCKTNISNIILSKKSHIFHSIKILIPKLNEINILKDSNQILCSNLNENLHSENIKRKNKEINIENEEECIKEIIDDGSIDTIESNEITYKLHTKNEDLNNSNSFEKIEKEFVKEEINKENILNNIYIDFVICESKIKKIEKRKKKNIFNDKNEILFVQNKLQRDIKIEKYNSISELYNYILESINYFNQLKVRNAYYSLRDAFRKYSCDKKLKDFIENIFISEILYRYKIIKKIEILFNLDVEKICEDFINYSIISKRVCKNFMFDYLIDLKDVNGKVCFMKYVSCLSKQNNNLKSIILSSNEVMDDSVLENTYSNKYFENFTTVSNESFSEIGIKKNEKKKNNNILKKEKKIINAHYKSIRNKHIDFSHFNIIYDEENNEVYYFVKKKEFSILKKFSSTSNIKNKLNYENEEKRKKEENKNNPNKFLLKTKKRYFKKEGLENNSFHQKDEKSDINTIIYFYVNLSIPSNFIYVVASMTEVTLFKSWIPFYSFPFKFGVSECNILKERGLADKIIYTKIAMPWIIKDRYLLMDIWICEDFQFSKGIFLYASNFPKNSEINKNIVVNTDNCSEIEITLHAFISPKKSNETSVKCHVEIDPNTNLNETFISFLTKVFIKSCISHFIKACREFEFNDEYINEMRKNAFFYEKLKKAAEKCKIY